jgi:hypothetical protein
MGYMNTITEEYLHAYTNYLPDDWAQFLQIAEFAANNQVSDAIIVSLSLTIYDFDL